MASIQDLDPALAAPLRFLAQHGFDLSGEYFDEAGARQVFASDEGRRAGYRSHYVGDFFARLRTEGLLRGQNGTLRYFGPLPTPPPSSPSPLKPQRQRTKSEVEAWWRTILQLGGEFPRPGVPMEAARMEALLRAKGAPEFEIRLFMEAMAAGPYRDRFIGVTTGAPAAEAVVRGAGLVPAGPQVNTPYVNTAIPDVDYPGDLELERKIRGVIQWNAAMMVDRANRQMNHETHEKAAVGGHISTYASAAVLYEVGFNHVFRAPGPDGPGDLVYVQGHAAPGIYARAFLEGRLTQAQLINFRRELSGGPSSYPHPWDMPDFWQVATVSMGLGPISAIYQARYNRYLQARGLANTEGQHLWYFMGDGESDEPESRGALHIAARDNLDNVTFVVNANLQRLDGPVRAHGNIIQELEGSFRGAGWNVIKVIWGSGWDPIFDADTEGLVSKRMLEIPDGQWQTFAVEKGGYLRDKFCNGDPRLLKFFESYDDQALRRLFDDRGGYDERKVYSAYQAALAHKGKPTVIIVQTIKGHGSMLAHNMKTSPPHMTHLMADAYLGYDPGIPVASNASEKDPAVAAALEEWVPFVRSAPDSAEMRYMVERREALGGAIPRRTTETRLPLVLPPDDYLAEFFQGNEVKELSTTMVLMHILGAYFRHPEFKNRIVPIIPDEARTFGFDPWFSSLGIYDANTGRVVDPADRKTGGMVYYKTSPTGQLLEEGITEAGSVASFTAAATSYATHGVPMVPFYVFYSMFGPQRTLDSMWANGDMRGRGFYFGATAGRTTLNGEGTQHADGHSHILAATLPNLRSYDPAFGYELAVIIQDGLRRMYGSPDNAKNEDVSYYITVYNETQRQAAMPEGREAEVKEGIVRGMYRYQAGENREGADKPRAEILASGTLMPEALKAQKMLAEMFGVVADVWSVTSYSELARDALRVERENARHLGEEGYEVQTAFVTEQLKDGNPVIAVTDFMKMVPLQIAKYVPGGLTALGTDGFGRSDTRGALRDYFEIDAKHIVYQTLVSLAQQGKFAKDRLPEIRRVLGIDPRKEDPATLDPARPGRTVVRARTNGADAHGGNGAPSQQGPPVEAGAVVVVPTNPAGNGDAHASGARILVGDFPNHHQTVLEQGMLTTVVYGNTLLAVDPSLLEEESDEGEKTRPEHHTGRSRPHVSISFAAALRARTTRTGVPLRSMAGSGILVR